MAKVPPIIFLLSLLVCSVSNAQWTTMNGPPGGTAYDIEIDAANNKVYALINNRKLYCSINEGTGWSEVPFPANTFATDVLIINSAIYAVTSATLYKSENNGTTWIRVNTAGQYSAVQKILKHPTVNSLFMYGSGGLYVSVDDGVLWTKLNDQNTVSAVVSSSGDLYFSDTEGIAKHPLPGDGKSWLRENATIVRAQTNNTIRLAVFGTNIFATISNDVLRSNDNGATWPSVKTATFTESSFTSSVWGVAGNGVYVTTATKTYFTSNGGTSWTAKPLATYDYAVTTVNDMKFASNTTGFAAASSDGVFKTVDGGDTWTLSSTGINHFNATSVAVMTSGRIVVSRVNSYGYWYSDNGSQWTFISLTDYFQKIERLPNNTLLALGVFNVQYSTDNGNNWTSGTVPLLDVTFNTTFSAGTFYGCGTGRIAKSTNGSTWTDLTITGLPTTYSASKIAQDNSGKLYVYLNNSQIAKNQLYRIDNITAAGTSGVATLLTIPLGDEDVDSDFFANQLFVSNNKLYVSSNYHIYISQNQGTAWSTVNFNKSSLFPIKKGTTYAICAGTSGSVYTSQDDGKSWTRSSMPAIYSTGYITDVAEDANGDYIGAGFESSVLKFTDELVLPVASLPPYIDFDWQPTDGPYGGAITRSVVDNADNVYTVLFNTIFKSNSTLGTWVDKSRAGTFFNDVEVDKSNNKLFALTSNQLYSSVNGGDTWDLLNNEVINSRRLLRRCPNGDLVFGASSPNGIFVSTDGGVTFGTPKYSFAPKVLVDIVVTSSSAIIVYLTPQSGSDVFEAVISTDRGVTWNPMPLHVTNEISRLSTDTNGKIYCTAAPPSKSNNNGQSWTSIAGNLPTETITSRIFVSPANALYVSSSVDEVNALYKSTNNGASWTKTGDLPGITSINYMHWIGTKIIISTIQGMYLSEDDGVTFTLKSEGLFNPGYLDFDLVNPSKLLVATSNGMNFSSTDFHEWTHDRNLNLRHFFKTSDGTLYGHTSTRLYTSPDDGDTWTAVLEFPEPTVQVVTPNGQTFYAMTPTKIFVSTDLVQWLELVVSGLPEVFSYRDIVVDSNGYIYALVFNSAIGDEYYQIRFGLASKKFTTPRSVLYHNGTVYVFESTGLISMTTNGDDWTERSAPNGNSLTITSNNYYFVPQSGGSVWLSRDEGNTWQNVGESGLATSVNFLNFVVNEFNGYAYATLTNSVVRKSATIIIPSETTDPLITSLLPANGAENVVANTTLRITFDEACVPVNGKKIRIFNAATPIAPVELLDVTAGVQDGKSYIFTPASPFTYENTYFIIVDPEAFVDIFGNGSAGIGTSGAWHFTIQVQPDELPPAITPVTPTFVKGEANKLQITVTDEGGSLLNPASVKVHYRGITSSATHSQALMTNSQGNTFEVTVPDAWLDELGLEYVFEALDNQGNKQLSPQNAFTTGDYHHAYITFPENVSPSLPSSVLSFGGQKGNYRVFSIPHKLSDAGIATVFDEISSLGVKKDFRILNFNTETGKYIEFPSLSTIERGVGYWINIKNSVSIAVQGASAPQNSKAQLFSLTLRPGWNQIGNPYPFTISWNAVKGASADIGVLKTFSGSSFVDDDKLNAFEGGFVLLNGTANVNIEVPFTARTSAGRTSDVKPDFAGGWTIPLTMENSSFRTVGGIGMHPDASMSFDHLDDAMPPKVFDIPEIQFDHREHFLKRFTRDIVPSQNEFVWTFSVSSPEEKGMLKWDAEKVRSLGSDLYLLDEKNQKLINMGEAGECEIAPESSASFKVYFGYRKEDIKPSRIMLGKPYPNPFTTLSTVAFTLPENNTGAYTLSLDVYDLLGRKVATLARGQFSSGFYTREWVPEPGTVNASVYLYRLTVSGSNTNLVLTEKIITK